MGGVVLLTLLCGALAVQTQDETFLEFVNGNHRFTAGIYKEILKKEKGNFIVSPLSAETVLALTNEGAKGNTSAELVSGLSLPSSKENTQKAFKFLLANLKKSDEELQLLSANKIYAGKGFKLENEFRTIATNVYESGVENVDFGNNVKAAATINNWVEENTNHKIKNLIEPFNIDGTTRAVLVNALYFSGQWVSKFKSSRTSKRKFYKNNIDTVEVDIMHQIEYFNCYENQNLNAKFLELPYKGDNISMIVVLPNEKDGLTRLEQNIEQLFVSQPLSSQSADVALPKFTIESKIEFISILKNLGVKKLFGNAADLSGLSSTDKGLYVSEILQKAFINVTEYGTEAAAATEVGLTLFGKPNPRFHFHADHPFLYLIKLNEVVLFIGRYTNP